MREFFDKIAQQTGFLGILKWKYRITVTGDLLSWSSCRSAETRKTREHVTARAAGLGRRRNT